MGSPQVVHIVIPKLKIPTLSEERLDREIIATSFANISNAMKEQELLSPQSTYTYPKQRKKLPIVDLSKIMSNNRKVQSKQIVSLAKKSTAKRPGQLPEEIKKEINTEDATPTTSPALPNGVKYNPEKRIDEKILSSTFQNIFKKLPFIGERKKTTKRAKRKTQVIEARSEDFTMGGLWGNFFDELSNDESGENIVLEKIPKIESSVEEPAIQGPSVNTNGEYFCTKYEVKQELAEEFGNECEDYNTFMCDCNGIFNSFEELQYHKQSVECVLSSQPTEIYTESFPIIKTEMTEITEEDYDPYLSHEICETNIKVEVEPDNEHNFEMEDVCQSHEIPENQVVYPTVSKLKNKSKKVKGKTKSEKKKKTIKSPKKSTISKPKTLTTIKKERSRDAILSGFVESIKTVYKV